MSGYDLIWFCIYGGLAVLIIGFLVLIPIVLVKLKKLNKRLANVESKLDITNNSQTLKSRSNADFTYKTLELLDVVVSNVMKDTISRKRKEVYLTLLEKLKEVKKEHSTNNASENKVIVNVKKGNKKDERRIRKEERKQQKQ